LSAERARHRGCTPASGLTVGREGQTVGREGQTVGWEGLTVGWEGRTGRSDGTVDATDGKVRRSMRLTQRSDREKANGEQRTTPGGSRLQTRIDRHADPTPFRHSFSSNSTNLSKYATQYHTSRRNLQNRPQTGRSTMAPNSRGKRPELKDAPKKIAVSRIASKSYSYAAIVSWRSQTPPPTGEAGLLISVDRPRWSGARE